MKFLLLLIAALLCAAPVSAQDPAPRSAGQTDDTPPGASSFLLARRAELALTARQVEALQRLRDRYEAQNRELRASVDGYHDAVLAAERRSENTRSGGGPRSLRSHRTAAREAAMQLRANLQREANEARSVLSDEQFQRVQVGAATEAPRSP